MNFNKDEEQARGLIEETTSHEVRKDTLKGGNEPTTTR